MRRCRRPCVSSSISSRGQARSLRRSGGSTTKVCCFRVVCAPASARANCNGPDRSIHACFRFCTIHAMPEPLSMADAGQAGARMVPASPAPYPGSSGRSSCRINIPPTSPGSGSRPIRSAWPTTRLVSAGSVGRDRPAREWRCCKGGSCVAYAGLAWEFTITRSMAVPFVRMSARRFQAARAKVCQTVPGKVVDPAISDLLLELMTPVTLETALAVRHEVEAQVTQTDDLLRQQVERARYEAELARHRYMKVDPDNRLVTDALEADWNARLRSLAEAQEACDSHRRQLDQRLDAASRARVLELAQDFPLIWNDPALGARERKRMLRLLIEDVTLIKAETITVHVRLRGGATRTLVLARPVPIAQLRKTTPAVVSEVDRLLDLYCDREVADLLNERGCRTWENEPFNLKKIAFIRQAYHLPSRYDRLRRQGLLTAREVAARFGIGQTAVHSWAEQGLLTKHHYDSLNRCLYEVPSGIAIIKGHGGHGARP